MNGRSTIHGRCALHKFIYGAMHFLVWVFALGWLGSLFVVVISGVEDLKTVFSKDDEYHPPIEG